MATLRIRRTTPFPLLSIDDKNAKSQHYRVAATLANALRKPARSWRVPAAVLLLGVLATGVSVSYLHRSFLVDRQKDFDSFAGDAGSAISRRVAAYSEALYGLRGLYLTNGSVSREQFHRYVTAANVQGRSNAAQAISFDRQVRRDQISAFEESIRSNKSLNPAYSTFKVHPETGGELHDIIEYIEPDQGNEAALGFDLSSNPVRIEAIDKARDTSIPVATAPIRLAQETGKSKGFLLLLAAYDRGELPVTTPARRRAFAGVFAAAFRFDDMMAGVLGASPKVNVEIYDLGPTVEPQALPLSAKRILFDSNGKLEALNPGKAPEPHRFLDINVGERRWRIFATPGAGLRAGAQEAVPIGVGIGGVALTLLVSGLLYAFARSQKVAVLIATEMTVNLRERERELNAANESLDIANRDLKDINQAMKDFVSTAAHDLRSPLSSVIGYSEMLTDDWASTPDDEKRQYIGVVERQSRQMLLLIEDLLTLSRIESGAFEIHPETIPAKEAIEDALAYHDQTSPGIEVGLVDHLAVMADRDHLRRIITNFVSNAVKYGESPIRVETRDAGTFVEIRVRDRGAGVPEEFVPRLFHRFSRADSVKAANIEGTGLGLSIVQGLARANGGDVWYEQNDPGGSCFGVRLPKPS